VQPPAAVGAGLAHGRDEPRAGVEHLDAQHTFRQSNAHLEITVLAHVFDRVRDQLGQQQAGVLERLRLEPDVFENARLLLSELVANAVEHVAEEGDLEVRIALSGGVLRVEVLDPGPGFVPPPRPKDSERGWGLHFTDRLASRWAADFDERARVWFELTLTES
jgi:two-component sensor histidine kinase